tara:strand:+ start:730 stop:1140 length:411 start_codon:yes stop_codon:yes gene_type:complete
MAFGAIQKFPNDTKPRVGIGVSLPFNSGGVFTPNYTTKQAIKSNLINFFLTNVGERPGNPEFGGGLRNYIFTQITENNLEFLKEDVSEKIKIYFPNINIKELNVLSDPDTNKITVQVFYSLINTSIGDEYVELTFE